MPKKRQTFVSVPSEAFTPIIPTEVFLELNPELEQFVYADYGPSKYHYVYQKYPYNYYKKWPCHPGRFCIPRPCAPV